MKQLNRGAVISLFSLLSLIARAHEPGAHVHGVATLQVAVDEKTLTLDLSSPLDNLLGFEHVPHNEKEKVAVRAMIDSLQKANLLFIPTAAAQCVLQTVNLDSPVIDKKTEGVVDRSKKLLTSATKPHEQEETDHADLDGEFVFKCGQTAKLRDLQVNLFQYFPHMRQIKVEIVSAHGQTATTLAADQNSVFW